MLICSESSMGDDDDDVDDDREQGPQKQVSDFGPA